MCSRPIERDGNIFACRSCNECIAVRRSNWVARAMAEKTDWPHTVCVTLTYNEETPEARQGARMFCYADVRAFIHRVNSRCRYEARKSKANVMPRLKFICAGEQGDRNGRCHWHLIIYSDMDLTKIGTFWGMKDRKKVVLTERQDMMSTRRPKREIRLDWDMWVVTGTKNLFGYVNIFEPDQRGMAYVLSYCLKDQFTGERSKETMREHRSENFATGLFKMSKRPPIGENWLMKKMEHLESLGAVLPSLHLKVPGFGGTWQPSGAFREKLLWCLVALNQRIIWATGAQAPQWSSLLASCKDNQSDMEILNGPQEEKPDFEKIARKTGQRLESLALWREEKSSRSGPCLCVDCLGTYSAQQLDEIGCLRLQRTGQAPEYRKIEGGFALEPFPTWRVCKFEPEGP